MSSSSNNKYQMEKIYNSNKYKYVDSYLNEKKIWEDQYPPDNMEKIYQNCLVKTNEIKNNLDNLDLEYGINGNRIFDTMNTYSKHLNRLKAAIGLNEIKSAKTISYVIKIINDNIKHAKKVQRKAEALKVQEQNNKKSIESQPNNGKSSIKIEFEKALTKEPIKIQPPQISNSTQMTVVDNEYFSDEENRKKMDEKSSNLGITIKKEKKLQQQNQAEPKSNPLDFTNTMNYVQKRRVYLQEGVNGHLLKKADSIITPMLVQAKKSQICVTKETEEDVKILQQLLDTTLKAIEEYAVVIQDIEKQCLIFEKYFLSFYEFIESYLPKRKSDSSVSNNKGNDCVYSKKPNDDIEKNRLILAKYNKIFFFIIFILNLNYIYG